MKAESLSPAADGLIHVEPGEGGIRRRRSGRGFAYYSANGRKLGPGQQLDRIKALAIPPAWNDVWVSSHPEAHIQATGVDDAGRRQYLYHPAWREQRDAEKFTHSLAFARRLPTLRRAVTRDLRQSDDGRRRALAAAVRLMDRAGLRVGGAEYAQENGSFGASTLQRRHVSVEDGTVHLRFRGKSGNEWDVRIEDELLLQYFESVPAGPRPAPALCFAVPRDGGRGGRRWACIDAAAINAYLERIAGPGFSAKDFRTWQGTVAAARSLARSYRAGDTSPAAVAAAMKAAAEWLHNTPAIARDSYVDPRVVELFERGRVADFSQQPDRAVVALLAEGESA
ncbi:DNA topoisomerase IB [Zhihengliuella sp.]|uniref:DNA topoisomerase IB n=1 Tax=Zhihengliuella sp. TaxID=1954483 RepID=UPI0028121970|nr:DNA topoisomerase IB [Zhihengliuella sp.]